MPLKRVFTTGEHAVYRIAQQIAGFHNVDVLAKTRIADAIEIGNTGITNQEYSFALKGHFDVLIVRGDFPILAIEFDGPGHDPKNDAIKNRLCDKFGLPLVRVRMGHLNSKTLGDSAVHFLVHQLFGVEEFEKQCSDPYEIYDPIFFVSVAGKTGSFPFHYSQHWRNRLAKRFQQNLHRFGPDVRSSYKYGYLQSDCLEGAWVKGAEVREVRALCSQSVGGGREVFGQAALGFGVFGMEENRLDKFLRLHPFVMGLAAEEMFEKAIEFLDGDDAAAVSRDSVRQVARQWEEQEGFKLVLAYGW